MSERLISLNDFPVCGIVNNCVRREFSALQSGLLRDAVMGSASGSAGGVLMQRDRALELREPDDGGRG